MRLFVYSRLMEDPFAETLRTRLGIDPEALLRGEPPPPPSADKRYTPVAEIGRGGLGRVLKVYDHNLKRHVAMKMLLDVGRDDPYTLTKFIEEAQIAAQLEHPNILGTYDIGLDRDGNLYFTMPLVYGDTLRTILNRLAADDPEAHRQYTLAHRVRIFQQICQAVAYAHSKGVVHRDLKPENIMIGAFGEVLVMDWGISKVMGRSGAAANVRTLRETGTHSTVVGSVIGTPIYMAPEQASGETTAVDERSDVYALGVMLSELVRLELPTEGQTAGLHHAPRELAAIVKKATAPTKDARYPNAGPLAADVEAFLEGRRGTAWRDNLATLTWKWIRRHRAISIVVIASITFLAALLIRTATRPGQLHLETLPTGADVLIDGTPMGRTPLDIRPITRGRHKIVLRLDRHEESSQIITIDAGSRHEHKFVLYPLYQTARIESEPASSIVEIRDLNNAIQASGPSPFLQELVTGTYHVTVRAADHVDETETLVVQGGGGVLPLLVHLKPNAGRLAVDTYQLGIRAVLGEQEKVLSGPLALAPGEHTIRFELENHYPETRTIEIQTGETTRTSAYLQPMFLWQSDIPQDRYHSLITRDVNSDGMPDLVAIAYSGRVVCVDGLTGRTLWSATPNSEVQHDENGFTLLESDLITLKSRVLTRTSLVNGSRQRFAIDKDRGAYVIPLSVQRAIAFSTWNNSIACVSLETGKELWEEKHLDNLYLLALIPDADGDGAPDLLAGLQDKGVTALSSRTRKACWERNDLYPSSLKQPVCTVGKLLALNTNDNSLVFVNSRDGQTFARFQNALSSGPLTPVGSQRVAGQSQEGLAIFDPSLTTPALTTPTHPHHVFTVADLNADGIEDFVLDQRALKLKSISGKTSETLFTCTLPARAETPPVVADFDGDGTLDVAVATDSAILAVRGRNDRHRAMRIDDLHRGARGFLVQGPDASPLLVLASDDQTHLITLEGRTIQNIALEQDASAIAHAAMTPEALLLARESSTLLRVPFDGSPVAELPLDQADPSLQRAFDLAHLPALWKEDLPFHADRVFPTIDLDGDGASDIAVTASVERRCDILAAGTGKSLCSVRIAGTILAADVDLNGDRFPELLSISGGQLLCVRAKDNVELFRLSGATGWSHPVAADFNGDGHTELALVEQRSTTEWLHVITSEGRTLLQYPLHVGPEPDRVVAMRPYQRGLLVLTQRQLRILDPIPLR